MTMGVAWGNTMSAISSHLVPTHTNGSAVVQLNASANITCRGLDYEADLTSSVATAFSATAHHYPVSAFFDVAVTKQAMWRERSVSRVLDVQRRMDLAVFSVGSLTAQVPSH